MNWLLKLFRVKIYYVRVKNKIYISTNKKKLENKGEVKSIVVGDVIEI